MPLRFKRVGKAAINTAFAHCDYLRVLSEPMIKRVNIRRLMLIDKVRVQAQAYRRIRPLAERQHLLPARTGRARYHKVRDTHCLSGLEYLSPIIIELGKIEVAVGINQHLHA